MSQSNPSESQHEWDALKLPSRYRVLSEIGRGGMGTVLRAQDLQLDRDIAIKVLNFDGCKEERLQQRFLQEAKTLAQLNHHAIVKLLGFGITEAGNPYHVLEFFEGEPLSELLLRQKVLKPLEFQQVFLQLLSGLAHAHENKIVHRDIKPSNVLVRRSPDGHLDTCIIDFGIAKMLELDQTSGQQLTKTGAMLGSPAYMSPEQCKGLSTDERSDIYSVACVMYESLFGRPPFQSDSPVELMYKHASSQWQQAVSLLTQPEFLELSKLIDRCLSKDPDERPQSLQEILLVLKNTFASTSDSAVFRIKGQTVEAAAFFKNRKVLLLLAAFLAAIFLLIGIEQVKRSQLKQQSLDQALKGVDTADTSAARKRKFEEDFQKNLRSRVTELERLDERIKAASNEAEKRKHAVDYIERAHSLAKKLVKNGRYEPAEEIYKNLIKRSVYTDVPFIQRTTFLDELAGINRSKSDYKAALKYSDEALAILEQHGEQDSELPTTIKMRKLQILLDLGDFDSAYELFDKFSQRYTTQNSGLMDSAGLAAAQSKILSCWRDLDRKFPSLKVQSERVKAIRMINLFLSFYLSRGTTPQVDDLLNSANDFILTVDPDTAGLEKEKRLLDLNIKEYKKHKVKTLLPSS